MDLSFQATQWYEDDFSCVLGDVDYRGAEQCTRVRRSGTHLSCQPLELEQKDQRFEGHLGYIVRPYLNQANMKPNK